jgi:hypothetical protein
MLGEGTGFDVLTDGLGLGGGGGGLVW